MAEQDSADTYGSDRAGLVWGYLLGAGAPSRQVTAEAAAEWLTGGSLARDKRFLWLHFSLANASSERWMRQHLELPETFFQSFREPEGSTRVEQDGDVLLAVIHDVLFSSTFEATDVSTVSLCVQPTLLVSARPKPLRSLDRLRAGVSAGGSFRSPAELLAHLLREQAGVMVEIVRRSTSHIDGVEDRCSSIGCPPAGQSWALSAGCWCGFSVSWRRNRPRCSGC